MKFHLFAALVCLVISGCESKDKGIGPDPISLKPEKDGTLTVTNSEGKQTKQPTGEITEAQFRLPFYPGSAEGGKGLSAVIPNPKGGEFIHSDRTTADSAAKVMAFYEPKMKNAKKKARTASGMTVETVMGEIEGGVKVWVSAVETDGKSTQITVQAKR